MKTCEQCGHTVAGSLDKCPHCGYAFSPNNNKKKKTLLIIIFSLLALVIAVGIILTFVILNQKKPKTFDFDCAGYTEEMNTLLDNDKKLDKNSWVANGNNSSYTYSGIDYTIELETDKSSKKVKCITVSPSDSENGVKMATASMMITDKNTTQDTAMSDLVKLKNGQSKVFLDDIVVTYDNSEKEFVIEPNTDENDQTTTVDPTEATNEPATIAPTTKQPAQKETTTEPDTEEPTTEKAADSWKQLYINFLNNECVFDYETGKLVYLNDDDVPELILVGPSDIQWSETVICWIDGDEVKVFKTNSGDVIADNTPSYVDRGGFLSVRKSGTSTIFTWYYYFDGSSVNEAHQTKWQEAPPQNNAFNIQDEYKIDDKDVTKEEVESFPETLGSFEVISGRTDKSNLKSYIENY